MLGGWWFGSASSPDSNFLRVANAFPNRRLSDNTLMTPKIRIAPSCASSPGGTPGAGLPIRRHSSIGPQERRGSTMNLSPPAVSILPICSKLSSTTFRNQNDIFKQNTRKFLGKCQQIKLINFNILANCFNFKYIFLKIFLE